MQSINTNNLFMRGHEKWGQATLLAPNSKTWKGKSPLCHRGLWAQAEKWGVYAIQQTYSKCIQNTRANAGRLLDRVNIPLG